ncbi:MAG: GatB/YqeY domain-containing protein [Chloroflexi bacterium]|nr:GatB/YqeY domain-containing protein [Chloroflexota bacterium]
MPLLETLERDAIAAVKAKDENRRDTLRFVLAAVKNEEVRRRPQPLDEEGVRDVLRKQAKMRRDSIEAFDTGGRTELAARERAQLAVIEEYLPKQVDAEAIREIARRVIAETGASGPREMGKVMPKVMAVLKDQADGKAVSQVVAELLKG